MAQAVEEYPVHNEDQCSRIGNYRYLSENDIPDELRREQEAQISQDFDLDDNNEARPCNCSINIRRQQKCTNNNCTNRRCRITCPSSCGGQCDNNPWLNDSWAVGKKIHLKRFSGPKKLGMFASKVIHAYEYIGEYTGRVIYDKEELKGNAAHYSFSFGSVKHALDSYNQGSAVRCINHSCDANCIVYEYVYNFSYHLVFKSKRKINPGEELTINYMWKWELGTKPMPCLCKTLKCNGIIGDVVDPKTGKIVKRGRRDGGTTRQGKGTERSLSGNNAHNSNSPPPQLVQDFLNDDDDDENGDEEEEEVEECEPVEPNGEDGEQNSPDDLDDEQERVAEEVPTARCPEPIEFPSVIASNSSEILRLLCTLPVPRERPSNYRETHVFTAMESVFVIVQIASRLRIVGGRVLQCFRNTSDVVIFLVRSFIPGNVDYYVPRFICFHYMEDAVFWLETIYSENDRQAIRQYTLNGASFSQSIALQNDVVLEYVERFHAGDLPETVGIMPQLNGPIAIGLPTQRLVLAPNPQDPNTTTEGDDDDAVSRDPAMRRAIDRALRAARNPQLRMSLTPAPSNSSQRQLRRRRQEETSSDTNDMAVAVRVRKSPGLCDLISSTSTSGSETRNEDEDDGGSEDVADPMCPAVDGYDHTYRMPLGDIIQMYDNTVIFRRMFDSAVENVTLLAQSRLQSDRRVPHTDLATQIRAELDGYYNLAVPHQRRFLLFTHYRMATEVYRPTSWNLQWCSLCGEHETFSYDTEQRRHFESHHSIVMSSYTCPNQNCGRRFCIPSHFRQHLVDCNQRSNAPDFLSSLRSNMFNHIIDAFADYAAMREAGGRQLHVIAPGLPLLRNFGNKSRSHSRGATSSSKGPVKMNVKEGKPFDKNVKADKVKFGIQKTYTKLEKWTDLQYEDEVDIDVGDEESAETMSGTSRRIVEGIVHDDERPGPSSRARSRSQKRPRDEQVEKDHDEDDEDEEEGGAEERRPRSKARKTCASGKKQPGSGSRGGGKSRRGSSRGGASRGRSGQGRQGGKSKEGTKSKCRRDETESESEVETD